VRKSVGLNVPEKPRKLRRNDVSAAKRNPTNVTACEITMNAKARVKTLAIGSLGFTLLLYAVAVWSAAKVNPSTIGEKLSVVGLETVLFLWAAIFLALRLLIPQDPPAQSN
jgi:hypothetical protein